MKCCPMRREKRRITSKPFFFGGFVFLGIALFVAYVTFGSMLRDYVVTRSWERVPAAIHHMELYKTSPKMMMAPVSVIQYARNIHML